MAQRPSEIRIMLQIIEKTSWSILWSNTPGFLWRPHGKICFCNPRGDPIWRAEENPILGAMPDNCAKKFGPEELILPYIVRFVSDLGKESMNGSGFWLFTTSSFG